jgi:hypothetical protein
MEIGDRGDRVMGSGSSAIDRANVRSRDCPITSIIRLPDPITRSPDCPSLDRPIAHHPITRSPIARFDDPITRSPDHPIAHRPIAHRPIARSAIHHPFSLGGLCDLFAAAH